MSRTSNQIIRPSGLRQSENGQYIYANCAITGKPTFFKPDYFTLVLTRDFGGDEVKMATGYVCKEVKKLRKAGKTDVEIKSLLVMYDVKAPKEKKEPKQKVDVAPKEPRVKRERVVVDESVKVKAPVVEKVIVKKVYPWQDNPNYFRSQDPGAINFSEATKATCFRPDLNLDSCCEGCPYYDRCTCDLRVAVADRGKAAKRHEKPTIRALPLVDGCFDKPVEEVKE